MLSSFEHLKVDIVISSHLPRFPNHHFRYTDLFKFGPYTSRIENKFSTLNVRLRIIGQMYTKQMLIFRSAHLKTDSHHIYRLRLKSTSKRPTLADHSRHLCPELAIREAANHILAQSPNNLFFFFSNSCCALRPLSFYHQGEVRPMAA